MKTADAGDKNLEDSEHREIGGEEWLRRQRSCVNAGKEMNNIQLKYFLPTVIFILIPN